MTPSSPVRSRLWFFVGAVTSYLAIPLLNAVSPLLALPAVTASFGGRAWAAIAVGQSLGATAAVLVELGWGLSGSQRVARMSKRNRAQAFGLSLTTKAIVGIPVIGSASLLASVLVSSEFRSEAAVVAAAAATVSFSAGWIFVGILKPRTFLYCEVLPRTALIAASAVAIYSGAPLWVYPVALLSGNVLAPMSAGVVLGLRLRDLTFMSIRRLFVVIAAQRAALSSNVFSSIYISLGTTVATLGATNATLLFASIDRLQRMFQQVMRTQNYVFKGWVGREVDPAERVRRAVRATFVSGAVGVGCGVVFAVTSPWVAELVFSGTVHVPPLAVVFAGFSVAFTCASMSTGYVLLVTLGRVSAVAKSAAVGAAVGLPGIFFGAMLFGGTGALAGQMLAEVSVLLFQIIAARARLGELRRLGRLSTPDLDRPLTLRESEADRM